MFKCYKLIFVVAKEVYGKLIGPLMIYLNIGFNIRSKLLLEMDIDCITFKQGFSIRFLP